MVQDSQESRQEAYRNLYRELVNNGRQLWANELKQSVTGENGFQDRCLKIVSIQLIFGLRKGGLVSRWAHRESILLFTKKKEKKNYLPSSFFVSVLLRQMFFYRPQTKLLKSYVFNACLSFCPQRGCLPQWMLGYTPIMQKPAPH